MGVKRWYLSEGAGAGGGLLLCAAAGFRLDLLFIFFDRGFARALVFLLHALPRVWHVILLFIFIDP